MICPRINWQYDVFAIETQISLTALRYLQDSLRAPMLPEKDQILSTKPYRRLIHLIPFYQVSSQLPTPLRTNPNPSSLPKYRILSYN